MIQIDLIDSKLRGKKVFIRVDYNVPLSVNSDVLDDTRIRRGLATIKWCADQGAKVIIATHLGYPHREKSKNLSTIVLKNTLENILKRELLFVEECVGDAVKKSIESMEQGEILLLQNLRFNKGEIENEEVFAEDLIANYDVYINDAFSVSHRNHASVNRVRKFVKERYLGLTIMTELAELSKLNSKEGNSIAVIGGGWKSVEKIDHVAELAAQMNYVLIGGALAQIFFMARGISLKTSISIPREKINLASSILESYKNVILPIDSMALVGEKNVCVENSDITSETQLFDIGPKTSMLFNQYVSDADIVFWNGPLGKYEDNQYVRGTEDFARYLANQKDLEVIICGGDTLAAINSFQTGDKYSYLSTGGGAALNFVSGREMPGIEASNG